MSSAVWNAMSAVALDKIYVFGGLIGTADLRQSIDEVKIYDPSQRAWMAGPRMPQRKQNAAIAVHDGKIYIMGGLNGSAGVGGSVTNTVDVFDPRGGQWEVAAPMSTPRTGSKAIVVDGRIYVVGGAQGSEATDTSEAYDPKTNTWKPGPRLQARRTAHCVEFVGGKGLVIGGSTEAATSELISGVEEVSFTR
jgi:N-acetylneuraminic acid mutarotase